MSRTLLETSSRSSLLAIGALLALLPGWAAAAEAPGAAELDETVAEALFLADTLPAGSHDLSLALAVERGAAEAGGEERLTALTTLELAAPLGERASFTVDLGIPADGSGIESPGASLKLLLREAGADATGFSASLALHGSPDREVDGEIAVGLGAIRPLGPISLRATALAATGLSSRTPRLSAGASAALALSARWRALAEVVADVSHGRTAVSAGPTMKLALGESLALMAGALFEVGAAKLPAFTLQLTQSM